MCTHTHTHVLMHTHIHTLSLFLSFSLSHAHTNTHTHTHTHTRSCTHIYTHSLSFSPLSLTHTQTHTHTQTQTHRSWSHIDKCVHHTIPPNHHSPFERLQGSSGLKASHVTPGPGITLSSRGQCRAFPLHKHQSLFFKITHRNIFIKNNSFHRVIAHVLLI